MAILCEMNAIATPKNTSFRSLADLKKAFQQRESTDPPSSAEHATSFRSLADLKDGFEHDQSTFPAEHGKSMRSLADLQNALQRRQCTNSRSSKELLETFRSSGLRSLTELKKDFMQRHVAFSRVLADQASTCTEVEAYEAATSSMTGCIKKLFQGQGYAFIAPADGSEDVFLHFRDVVNGHLQDLFVGAELHFELVVDEHGKRKAKTVHLTKIRDANNSVTTESSACHRYSRKMLLDTFAALCKVDALSKDRALITLRADDALSKDAPPGLSKELHADANIMQISCGIVDGDRAFEKVRRCRVGSEDSIPTADGDSASERESIETCIHCIEA